MTKCYECDICGETFDCDKAYEFQKHLQRCDRIETIVKTIKVRRAQLEEFETLCLILRSLPGAKRDHDVVSPLYVKNNTRCVLFPLDPFATISLFEKGEQYEEKFRFSWLEKKLQEACKKENGAPQCFCGVIDKTLTGFSLGNERRLIHIITDERLKPEIRVATYRSLKNYAKRREEL